MIDHRLTFHDAEMAITRADAIRNAYAWFEINSGWAPPDAETLAEWVADGVCRCPDECLVAPDAWCEHGLACWSLILEVLDSRPDRTSRKVPDECGRHEP